MTEQSKLSPEIIELGKALVAHLAEEKQGRDDLLSKWMAHDIAAKITTAQADPSDSQAQNDCSLAILRLWEHRAVFPHPKRPTDQYESILLVLERLDPSRSQPLYLPDRIQPTGEEGKWLSAAISFDGTARLLITYVLNKAAVCAEGDIDWSQLANAAGLSEAPDLRVVRSILLGLKKEILDPKAVERQRLQALLAKLTSFQKAARLIAAELKSDLEALEPAGAADANSNSA